MTAPGTVPPAAAAIAMPMALQIGRLLALAGLAAQPALLARGLFHCDAF